MPTFPCRRHIMKKLSLFILATALLIGCGAPQKPYSFNVGGTKTEVIDAAVRTLALEGHQVDTVDEQAGVIHTKWRDTGYGGPYTDHSQGYAIEKHRSVIQRIIVAMTPHNDGQLITLRTDVKDCEGSGLRINDEVVTGACSPARRIPGRLQKELDALGQKLQQASGGTAIVPEPAPGTEPAAAEATPAAADVAPAETTDAGSL